MRVAFQTLGNIFALRVPKALADVIGATKVKVVELT